MTDTQSDGARRRARRIAEPIESGTYTLPDAARRLGIGVTTIYDLNRRGLVPVPVLRIGKQMRVRKSDVEAYLAAVAAPARKKERRRSAS